MKSYHRVDCRARIAGLAVIGLVGLAIAGQASAEPIPLIRWGFDVVIIEPFPEKGSGISSPPSENQPGVLGCDISAVIGSFDMTLEFALGTGYPSDRILRTRFVPGSDVTSLPLALASYIDVAIVPTVGQTINIKRLEFKAGRTGPGGAPAGFAVRSNNDAFSTDLFVGSINAFEPNQDHFTVDFAPGVFLTSGNTIFFRFFFYGPTLESTIDIDDIEFFGCVAPLGGLDSDDYTNLEACLDGPGGGLGTGCECFDFDNDGDNDLGDFAAFQILLSGP
ncbi:MAG: hypothetical protein GXP29_11780 [Planctomycetes bacterium]|nr:hypothetical protein [Planctomycetota bacterium]